MAGTHVSRSRQDNVAMSEPNIFQPANLEENTTLDLKSRSTIVYATVGRAQYAFDIYSKAVGAVPAPRLGEASETRLTDGASLNYNGAFAGYSAEEISTPHQFQPYGDIFTIKVDGTGLRRLTHDPYENGTPAWGSEGTPRDLSSEGHTLKCDFSDSVSWLRPRNLRASMKQATQGASKQEGAALKKWCPFTPSVSKGAEVSISK